MEYWKRYNVQYLIEQEYKRKKEKEKNENIKLILLLIFSLLVICLTFYVRFIIIH